jgi:hypothetical protein
MKAHNIAYLLVFAGLLLVSSGMAADLDSTRQARVAVYGLLGLDTTGTDNLSTGKVDFYVNQAIQKINEDLRIYRKHENISLVDGKKFYALDSVVFLTSAWCVNGDSTYGLRAVDMDTFYGVWEYDAENTGIPEYYFLLGDSLGVVPVPRSSGTVKVLYTQQIPTDSLRIIPVKYRLGVVLFATYLASKQIGITGTFYNDYVEFVNSKRGIDPSKN